MKFTLPNFEGKPVAEIIEIIKQIPESIDGKPVDEIDFAQTELFKLNWDPSTTEAFMLPVNGIIEIIKAIPDHIKHLNLSNCDVCYANTGSNNNGRINYAQAELLYSEIGHPRFNEITFWGDSLGDIPNLAQFIGKLQQKRINLSTCFLWKAPVSRLENAAKAISEKVTYLDISRNGLNNYAAIKSFIFALASKNIQEIDVGGNHLDDLQYNSPTEIISIFSPLREHCSVKGIDLKAIRDKAATTTSAKSVATLKQEIETLASSIINTNLQENASLSDCINALIDLFRLTRSGMNSVVTFFAGADIYMQMKCAMAVAEIGNIQNQLASISNATTSEAAEFLTEFSNIKTINIDDKMSEYTTKLQDIVDALPAERIPEGTKIMNRILVISRQTLNELSSEYENVSQRHNAGSFSSKTSI